MIQDRIQAALEQGISQADIARTANVAEATVHNVRTGRTANPGFQTVARIDAAIAILTATNPNEPPATASPASLQPPDS